MSDDPEAQSADDLERAGLFVAPTSGKITIHNGQPLIGELGSHDGTRLSRPTAYNVRQIYRPSFGAEAELPRRRGWIVRIVRRLLSGGSAA